MRIEPIALLSEMTELESEYYEFQKVARTFNGWALTLDAEEFDELLTDFTILKGKESRLPPKYKILDYVFDDIHEFYHEDFTEDLIMKGEHLKRISLSRMGYCTYTPAEEDKDWKFTITKEGMAKANEIDAEIASRKEDIK